MLRAALSAAFLLAASTVAMAASDDELKEKIVGTWSDTASCENGMLTFKADGSFFSGDDAEDENARKGSFKIEGGKLTGSAGDLSMPEATVSFDGETLLLATGDRTDRLVRCSEAAQ